MKQIGERIKVARVNKQLTQGELAKLIGAKTGSVVSAWEMGVSKPDCERLVAICTALGVTPNSLLGFQKDSCSVDEMVAVRKYRALDERGKNVVDNVLNTEYDIVCNSVNKKKPKILQLNYFTMPASAGTGLFLDSELAEKILVYDCEEAEEADFVLSVKGDSMEPDFSDGDKIFVCKQDAVDVGEIGIFVLNGDVYIKELGNGKLISRNEKYKPIKINADDSVYCCGRVLGVVEEVKGIGHEFSR